MYESFFFSLLFGLDEKLEKKKERERKRGREDLPYCYDDDEDEVFFTRNIRQERHKTAKKCADGWSEFDFFFLLLKIPDLASCDDYTHIEGERAIVRKVPTLPYLTLSLPIHVPT